MSHHDNFSVRVPNTDNSANCHQLFDNLKPENLAST